MTHEEQQRRIADIERSLRRTLRDMKVTGGREGAAAANYGAQIATLGANLVDAAEGRDAYGDGCGCGLSYGARGSTTRKVRKALGYTYP